MNKILGMKKVPKSELEYLVIGSTIPWHWKFWNAPLVASCLGQRIPGYHIEQACATGLQAVLLAASEIEGGSYNVVGVLTFDRTSDSPVGVFPERRAYRRTEVLADVWDNFGFDPATGNAMIKTAGISARKYKIDREEVDDITFFRYKQYFDTKNSGWFDSMLSKTLTCGVKMETRISVPFSNNERAVRGNFHSSFSLNEILNRFILC